MSLGFLCLIKLIENNLARACGDQESMQLIKSNGKLVFGNHL